MKLNYFNLNRGLNGNITENYIDMDMLSNNLVASTN